MPEATAATTPEAAPATDAAATPPPALTDTAGAASDAEAAPPPPPTTADKLARAKAAAERAKAGAKQFQETQQRAAQFEYQARQAAAENQRLRQEQETTAQRLALLRRDPVAAMQELGFTPQQVADKIKRAGTPEAMLDEVRAELAAERSERKALQDKIEAAERAANYRTATAAFMTDAQDSTLYPTVAKQPPAIVLAAAKQILAESRDERGQPNGHLYSRKEVLEFLESQWSAHGKDALAVPKDTGTREPPSVPGAPEKPASPATSRTITNAVGATRFTFPANFDELPDREQRKLLAKALESGTK